MAQAYLTPIEGQLDYSALSFRMINYDNDKIRVGTEDGQELVGMEATNTTWNASIHPIAQNANTKAWHFNTPVTEGRYFMLFYNSATPSDSDVPIGRLDVINGVICNSKFDQLSTGKIEVVNS